MASEVCLCTGYPKLFCHRAIQGIRYIFLSLSGLLLGEATLQSEHQAANVSRLPGLLQVT
jgi:hypothetical protein